MSAQPAIYEPLPTSSMIAGMMILNAEEYSTFMWQEKKKNISGLVFALSLHYVVFFKSG
jgi:hypothetical protein